MKLIIDKKQVRLNGKLEYNLPYIYKYGSDCESTLVYKICSTHNCSERQHCGSDNCTLLEYNGYRIFICGKLRCNWLYI